MSPEDAHAIDEKRLELAMEAAGLDLWEHDLRTGGVIRKASKVFVDLGYSAAETALLINDIFVIVHPDDVAPVRAALAEHMSGKVSTYHSQLRLRSRTGSWVWYANHGKIVGDAGNERLIGVTYNIDERMQREAQLLEQQRQLAASEARHRQLLRQLHTAIVVHAPDTRILYSNPRASALLGIEEDRMSGMLAIDPAWRFVDEQGVSLTVDQYPVSRVLADGKPLETLVLGVRDGDTGSARWLLVYAFAEFEPGGAIKQVVVNFDDISPRKQAEEKIHHLAFFDPLTGLPNRRLLLDRLQAAMAASSRNGCYGAVLFIDLDRFKTINDVLGHGMGDQMLIEVAARIGGCVRDSDTVARFGGDEFVVVLSDIDADIEAASQKTAQVADKIRQALGIGYQLKGSVHHSTPSIGVALYRGNEETAEILLRQADMAMYKAKDAGRNTMRFFSAAMQQAVETHAALEADLRHAVARNQLRLLYQVQVDAQLGTIGAEALVRWIHPERGTVSPMQFIHIAEESTLIIDIGRWVLDTACAELARWRSDPQLGHLTLAVNVSAQQFRQPDFVAMLDEAMKRHGIAPARLKLELTESVVLSDVDDVVRKMLELRALGLTLSMDDFGTGYSSLAYLKRLPLDQVKIDQSFVSGITTDPNDAVMVKTIIDLARNFNLQVIAEGVETEAQLAFLKLHGCSAFQGYLFSKPIPTGDFAVLARRMYGARRSLS
ncbi:MAG: EAL domain-containing protein [Pseudomonadota bacterium]